MGARADRRQGLADQRLAGRELVKQLAPADGPLTEPSGQHALRPGPSSTFVAVGATLVWLFGVSAAIVTASVLVNLAFLVFFLRHVAFAAAAVRWAPQDLYGEAEVDLEYRPNVSIVVACHNEALVADSLVRGLKALHYPRSRLEIILVDDGSTDGTGELLDALTAGDRHMHVLHRPAGLPAAASPGALNLAAEHGPRRDPRRSSTPTTSRAATSSSGWCGTSRTRRSRRCRAAASCATRWSRRLARSIAIDYFSGYLVNEYGRQALFELPAYGGANCAVRASTLRRLGGWNTDSVTEDTDLTHARGHAAATGSATTSRRWTPRRARPRCAGSCPSATAGPAGTSRCGATTAARAAHPAPERAGEDRDDDVPARLPRAGAVRDDAADDGAAHRRHRPDASPVFELLPLAALLFAGPFCELAVGLMVGRAPRRSAWSIAWMTPIFFVFMLVCTKAWVDGLLGRQYAWVEDGPLVVVRRWTGPRTT